MYKFKWNETEEIFIGQIVSRRQVETKKNMKKLQIDWHMFQCGAWSLPL